MRLTRGLGADAVLICGDEERAELKTESVD